MRGSLHHLRKECQHYEVSIQVPSPTSPPGLYPPCHFLMEKPWGSGCFRTIIVGHVIRSLMLITCSYNRRDFSRGTGEDAHQNDGAEPLLETSLNVAKAVFTSEK